MSICYACYACYAVCFPSPYLLSMCFWVYCFWSNWSAGTALYCAPELLKCKYSFKADVWSAGVIVSALFHGCSSLLAMRFQFLAGPGIFLISSISQVEISDVWVTTWLLAVLAGVRASRRALTFWRVSGWKPVLLFAWTPFCILCSHMYVFVHVFA